MKTRTISVPALLAVAAILCVGCAHKQSKTNSAHSSPSHFPSSSTMPATALPPVRPLAAPHSASDARLKRDVAPYDRGLKAIAGIRTVRFRYEVGNPYGLDPNHEHVGVIAQELESVVPEAVARDQSGYRMVDPNPVLWSAVKAIQELKRENDELNKRIAQLERHPGK